MDESSTLLPPHTDRNIDRRSVSEMLGEVMREVAVLLFVFIPLDLALQGHGLTIGWAAVILVVPAAFLAAGIYVERTRRQ